MIEADFSKTVSLSMAARILGISVQHVKRLAEAGKLNPVLTPIGRLFELAEVEMLKAERAADQARKATERMRHA